MSDIFRFWAQVGPTDHVHPADKAVLSRVNHGFDLKCLPGCFWGAIETGARGSPVPVSRLVRT